MEQKKIEHITLHLIVFGTIAIIGVLARQTVLHYGWDEFSSYLILVVCSIIMGAIYLNLQMVFRQLLSPTIEKCFMRFECYRNKAVVVEAPAANSELAGSSINSKPIISEPEPEIEIETTSDITEEVSTLSCSELNEDVAELPKEETTPSTSTTHLSKNPTSHQNTRLFVQTLWQRKNVPHKKNSIRLSHTQNKLWFPILMKRHLIACVDMWQNITC